MATVTERRQAARQRARKLQEAEYARLERMRQARTAAFLALEERRDLTAEIGVALGQLLEEGESKRKLASDFGLSWSEIQEALREAGLVDDVGDDSSDEEAARSADGADGDGDGVGDESGDEDGGAPSDADVVVSSDEAAGR